MENNKNIKQTKIIYKNKKKMKMFINDIDFNDENISNPFISNISSLWEERKKKSRLFMYINNKKKYIHNNLKSRISKLKLGLLYNKKKENILDCKTYNYKNNKRILISNNIYDRKRKYTCKRKLSIKSLFNRANNTYINSFEKHKMENVFGKCDTFDRICGDTLTNMIEKKTNMFIIDTRYNYEYIGGHIKNSINITTRNEMDTFLEEKIKSKNVVIVIHCEYSLERAPTMASYIRNQDRRVNEYPYLSFPYIYILDGGYRQFYQEFKNYCKGDYIRMEQYDESSGLFI